MKTVPSLTHIDSESNLRIVFSQGRLAIDNLQQCQKDQQSKLVRFEIEAGRLIVGERNATQILKFWFVEEDMGGIQKVRRKDTQDVRFAHTICAQTLDKWIMEQSVAWDFIKDCALSSDAFIEVLSDPRSCFSVKNATKGFLLKGQHPTYDRVKCIILDADVLHCISQLRANGFQPEVISASTFDGKFFIDPKPVSISSKMPSHKLLGKFAKEISTTYEKLALANQCYFYLSADRLKDHKQIRRKQAIAPGETLADYTKRLEYAGLDPLAAKSWPEPGWVWTSQSEPAGKMVFSASEASNPMCFSHVFEKELFTRVFALVPKGSIGKRSTLKSPGPKKVLRPVAQPDEFKASTVDLDNPQESLLS